tara:strand:+ start:232 stop:414 length:183 start_codon:yes stop_codon:yes gene_type:complete
METNSRDAKPSNRDLLSYAATYSWRVDREKRTTLTPGSIVLINVDGEWLSKVRGGIHEGY